MRLEKSLIGALTSKPYAFTARPWELRSVYSIDFFDSFGTQIRVDTRGMEILRVVPVVKDNLNEEWITDKVRFSYDSYKSQRLLKCLVRTGSSLSYVSLEQAYLLFWKEYSCESFVVQEATFCGGKTFDIESAQAVREWGNKWFGGIELVTEAPSFDIDLRSAYCGPLSFSEITHKINVLLANFNARLSLPLFNVKLRRAVVSGQMRVFTVGPSFNFGYPTINLGLDVGVFFHRVVLGRTLLCKHFVKEPSAIIFGNVLSENLVKALRTLFTKYPAISIVKPSLFVSQVGLSELGWISKQVGGLRSSRWFINFSADEVASPATTFEGRCVYFGHTGDLYAKMADFIFPVTTPWEQESTYLSNEGQVLTANLVISPQSRDVRTVWSHMAALDRLFSFNIFKYGPLLFKEAESFSYVNFTVQNAFLTPFNLLLKLPLRFSFSFVPASLKAIRQVVLSMIPSLYSSTKGLLLKESVIPLLSQFAFISAKRVVGRSIDSFFFTHNITRASQNMALASARFQSRNFF